MHSVSPAILMSCAIAYSCSDDPEVFKGAPISLQLVGGTLEEEAVIAMTEIVDSALKKYKATDAKL